MKLVLGNSVSILIREEDFVEITVGSEEISYLRPNGSRAVIKIPQAGLPIRSRNEDETEKVAKREETRAAAEIARQKRREIWAQEQNKKEEELHHTLEENKKYLETMINEANSNIKSTVISIQKQVEDRYSTLKETYDRNKELIQELQKDKLDDMERSLGKLKKEIEEDKIERTKILFDISQIRHNINKTVVPAHNILCEDVEEMDRKLEEIHRHKYTDSYARKGKCKIILK